MERLVGSPGGSKQHNVSALGCGKPSLGAVNGHKSSPLTLLDLQFMDDVLAGVSVAQATYSLINEVGVES